MLWKIGLPIIFILFLVAGWWYYETQRVIEVEETFSGEIEGEHFDLNYELWKTEEGVEQGNGLWAINVVYENQEPDVKIGEYVIDYEWYDIDAQISESRPNHDPIVMETISETPEPPITLSSTRTMTTSDIESHLNRSSINMEFRTEDGETKTDSFNLRNIDYTE
ncbi:hypothetical protein [Salsuginibacillus kocurii]|uniref:hypothetical protein n=1 Tax=Salsuginibacillus kocurii TaxID=427078 RepID=UPI00037CDC33|nr:hypothetical protein [Salsuginibacillus kocurii]